MMSCSTVDVVVIAVKPSMIQEIAMLEGKSDGADKIDCRVQDVCQRQEK